MGHPTEAEIERMRAFQRERRRRREEELARRLERAREDCRRIIETLASDFEVARIWQWGSLLDGRSFSERSDIDLALEGVRSAEEFFAMYGTAESLTSFPVDLVELEKIDPVHARHIRDRGRVVYERNRDDG